MENAMSYIINTSKTTYFRLHITITIDLPYIINALMNKAAWQSTSNNLPTVTNSGVQ